jgi:hypothetical protein
MNDDDKPASPEELEAARRLAAALETVADAGPDAEMIRAATGRSAPLGELRARALVREALLAPRRRRRWWPLALPLLAAAILLLLLGPWFGLGRDPVPERLRARSAGLRVPGPFPGRQTAAQRLDRVTSDRLVALREARCRAVSRGAQ